MRLLGVHNKSVELFIRILLPGDWFISDNDTRLLGIMSLLNKFVFLQEYWE